MLLSRMWQYLPQFLVSSQTSLSSDHLSSPDFPTVAFLQNWNVLGPFQIGTREASWGADPLERYGGFRSLEYSNNATFRSSLAPNGTIGWSNVTAKLPVPDKFLSEAELTVGFPHIDWENLQNTYGWPALQWQAWARGQIINQGEEMETLSLSKPQMLEFWVDGVHYFGGDFYGYNRVPITLRLTPGIHRIDLRLVRDVRAMGGVGEPDMQINLKLEKATDRLHSVLQTSGHVLTADFIGDLNNAALASQDASVVLKNDGHKAVNVHAIESQDDSCFADELGSPVRIIPGQTRPVAFRFDCVTTESQRRWDSSILFCIRYRVEGDDEDRHLEVFASPRMVSKGEPHKVTFMHPGGIVSYAILRPPSEKAVLAARQGQDFPILLSLHGAGVEADSDIVRESLDPVPDFQAWALFPTGVSPWSGDDWHAWGFADVEAAVEMVPKWIERFIQMAPMKWVGPGADVDKWLVSGHSNGGQGTWYTLTHRPDKVFAAAPISGYTSIQNYVPYTFWHAADPARTAIVQSALLSYNHELLLPNAKGIAVQQQHGGADDNVPVYHSRLMSQLIQEAGADSDYYEVPGQGHYWDGVYTTEPLKDFYERQIELINADTTDAPLNLRKFTLVTANPGDTGPKHGVEILQLAVPGQLGQIDVTFDPLTLACIIRTQNLRMFRIPLYFRDCSFLQVDGGYNMSTRLLKGVRAIGSHIEVLYYNDDWTLVDAGDIYNTPPPPAPPRKGRQMGAMDAIFHTEGAFQIVQHSPAAGEKIALQISRNLHQYFFADTSIITDYEEALSATGNVISIAIGDDFPRATHPFPDDFESPIQVRKGHSIFIRGPNGRPHLIPDIEERGLGAIFLRPLPGERLELVVWGADVESLAVAARLVPMMTGVGQPDYVVMDRRILWKGLEGTLAMGFFDNGWEVSGNSFLGV